MCPGEVKTFTIVSENAYGQHRDDMVIAADRHQVPEHLDLQVNQQLQLVQEDGQSFVVQVTGLSESTVTLTQNHPLAGQDLIFEIELMETYKLSALRKKTMQESKLYVGNLNYAVTEAQLEELFAPYGDVRSVKIVEGRGFGFKEMATPEEAEQAVPKP